MHRCVQHFDMAAQHCHLQSVCARTTKETSSRVKQIYGFVLSHIRSYCTRFMRPVGCGWTYLEGFASGQPNAVALLAGPACHMKAKVGHVCNAHEVPLKVPPHHLRPFVA